MQRCFVGLALLLLSLTAARGGGEQPIETAVVEPAANPFAKGAKEFQNVAGAYYFFDQSDNRPAVDYAVDSLRFGIMLSNPHGSNFLAGNFEFVNEIFAGPIFQGPGDVVAGSTLFIRYNFVQPHAPVIPYLQIGGGLVYTDISERESGGLVSLPVEFNLQGTLGFRFMVNDRWSVVAEGEYRHISNATIKLPNFGIDSVGGNLGFGFFF
jgi:hypothetical protein